MIRINNKVILKDGRIGVITDFLGNDYIVDVGEDPDSWDTIIVSECEIEETSITS